MMVKTIKEDYIRGEEDKQTNTSCKHNHSKEGKARTSYVFPSGHHCFAGPTLMRAERPN